METERNHTVNIVRSASRVNVYSTLDRGSYSYRKLEGEYKSLDDAQNKISGELNDRHRLSKMYKGIVIAEKAYFGILVLKDVINVLTNNGEHNDLLPIFGIMVTYFITKAAEQLNTTNSFFTNHRLLAIKEAQKASLAQYEQSFPLFPDNT